MEQIIHNMIGVLIICIIVVFNCYIGAVTAMYDRTKMAMVLLALPFATIGVITLNELLPLFI